MLSLMVALVAAPDAGAAASKTVTASGGGTTATLTYRFNGNGAPFPDSQLALRIVRNGSTRYAAPVRALLCGTECSIFSAGSTLAVRTLEPGRAPDVVLNLYSGGAHCCFVTQIYRPDTGTQGYTVVQRDFGDPGARIEALGGGLVFRSADDRFAYAFAAFAFSGLPVQIWSFASGRFVDVTRRFPALIAHDAAGWYKDYLDNRKQRLGLGALAAWAADEYLLGHSASVRSQLRALAAAGQLRSLAGWSSGGAFVAQLERFLAKSGYER